MVRSSEIADLVDATHVGDPRTVQGFDDLGAATESDLAFCVYDDPEYVRESDAGVIVCLPSIPAEAGTTLLKVSDPKRAFWIAVDEFFRERPSETQIHPTAVVEAGATIGEACIIGPHVHITDAVTLGDRCRVMAGTTIGETGFGWARDDNLSHTRITHSGGVHVEDDVDIGSNCSIDRSIFDRHITFIGEGTKICNLVHVGHQVQIGQRTEIMQQVNISGNAVIGDTVRINPMAAIANNITVESGADIGMKATVLEDVESHVRVVGTPARVVQEKIVWWDE
jgi:UDP-3-O-[3-hydroxymyristoyl] glucosamine N-acyltransferase